MSMRYIFIFILVSCTSFSIQAQVKTYVGQAIHYPSVQAIEEFVYSSKDSAMMPIGAYTLRLQRDGDQEGKKEILKIRSNFRNGQPHGEFTMVIYSIQFGIDDFDFEKVSATVQGEKIRISGRYTNGQWTGRWRFERGKYQDEQASQIIDFQANTQTWSYRDDSLVYAGKSDAEGYFLDKWTWNTKSVNTDVQYISGLLEKITLKSDTSNLAFASGIDKKTNSIRPSQNQWLWNPGFQQEEEAYILQSQIEKAYEISLPIFGLASAYLQDFSFFHIPELKGIRLPYYSLSDSDSLQGLEAISKIQGMDSLLQAKITQPIISIRIGKQEEVDQVVVQTQQIIDFLAHLESCVQEFLSPNARITLPGKLKSINKKIFNDHAAYFAALMSEVESISDIAEKQRESLAVLMEKLREQGALEELEKEWLAIQEQTKALKPEDTTHWASIIFDVLVLEEFSNSIAHYQDIQASSLKRQFLLDQISWQQELHDFYLKREYLFLSKVYDEFKEAYTRYLYNPYMGVNNVEHVLKKKFLTKVLEDFWPYLLNKAAEIDSRAKFETQVNDLRKYKEHLLYFAQVKSVPAKRMEKRVLKASNWSEVEEIIKEYFEEHPLP